MIKIIGGGLSGLFAAYAYRKAGYEVELYEKSNRLGGMIQSQQLPWGLVETAANGLINSRRVEELSADIGVELRPMRKEYKKRFIFRGRPRQMPLTSLELLRFSVGLIRRPRPLEGETLYDYSSRNFGIGATRYLIEPAMMGIFGVDTSQLSATLVYDYFFRHRAERGKGASGTVAPIKGMGALVDGLAAWLDRNKVKIHLGAETQIESGQKTVIATDAHSAADLLSDHTPASQQLRHIQYQPIYSITLGFEAPGPIKGFGCLFPRPEDFRSMGVLFNNYIFEDRGPLFCETWIFHGRDFSESEAYESVLKDRRRLYERDYTEPQQKMVTFWKRGLPVYDTVLERFLRSPALPPNIQLIGNYTGRMGLAKILEQAFELSTQ